MGGEQKGKLISRHFMMLLFLVFWAFRIEMLLPVVPTSLLQRGHHAVQALPSGASLNPLPSVRVEQPFSIASSRTTRILGGCGIARRPCHQGLVLMPAAGQLPVRPAPKR